VIQADAFSGYHALTRPASVSDRVGRGPPPLIHAACWAHARRKFYDVFESTKLPIAEEALKRIGELYKIEAGITGQPAETRLATRQSRAVAILDALRDWLTAQRRRLSAKNALAKAIQYALSRWEALTRYAGDGRLAIDNNVAERALRGIAITRKNFLFLGSDTGGERAAILYTVLETAKLNGLDPQAYLADVINRIAGSHPINRLGELLPWNWQHQPARLAA
jgi:transposase